MGDCGQKDGGEIDTRAGLDSVIKQCPPLTTTQSRFEERHPSKQDMFVIMRSSTNRFYIDQVLDLYKRGANSRYGSVELASSAQGLSWLSLRVYLPLQLTLESDDDDDADADENPPDFTCTLRNNKYHLHTHAPADHLIYHLGRNALLGDNQLRKSLAPLAASHWKAVQCTKAVIKQHLHTRPQNTYSRRKNIRDSAEGIAYPFITSTPTSLSLLNIL